MNPTATPCTVRQVALPPAARALSTLGRVDYVDAFRVETASARERTGEEWARAVLEAPPAPTRQALRRTWFALGLKLGPTGCDQHVLGWELRRNTPAVALLGAGARLGLAGELLLKRERSGLLFATFVQLKNPIARAVWAGVRPGHQQVVRSLLGRAGSSGGATDRGTARRAVRAPPPSTLRGMASQPEPSRESGSNGSERERPELLNKLEERKRRHEQRGLPARVGVVVLGVLLVLLGILMSGPGIPGPGIVVILIGLSFLALEFDRAERLLERAIVWADNAKRRADAASPRQKALSAGVALVAVAAFVLAAIRWDIPLLPV